MLNPATPNNKTLILIVDDELFMRVTFQDILEKAGFMTAVAADGASAISSCMQMQPDLILLDLVMPGKDGFTTCQEIRNIQACRYTPILMVTGPSRPERLISLPSRLIPISWVTGCATCCGPA
jgi:CheY-like chemotaxis protein